MAVATTRHPRKKSKKPKRVSRLHKPDHLTLNEWQSELRAQFGRDQAFNL